MQRVYFAGGCFWGVEYYFLNLQGVISTRAGYMGGRTKYPNYEEVCTKQSGHAEIVEVVFDETKVTYQDIAKLFFEIHDPGQLNRQGPDIGDQYRSEIFYTTQEQKIISQELMDILMEKGFTVVTKLTKAEIFWAAEEYHQKYYSKNGHKPYCHIRKAKFD
ncbi:MAG: peptide-methionine (S)-S-oxide reductase MsrA [Anaerolineaceae bacterium]|nr:peptide-methionine (S)-S-oxide reductase MsrA [Anaerolineaceae bacterium]